MDEWERVRDGWHLVGRLDGNGREYFIYVETDGPDHILVPEHLHLDPTTHWMRPVHLPRFWPPGPGVYDFPRPQNRGGL